MQVCLHQLRGAAYFLQMAQHWIPASKALELAGSDTTLLRRLRAGSLKSRASVLTVESESRTNASLSPDFWTDDRYTHFVADWAAGDFSNTVDAEQWVALGVELDFSGVAELLPPEQRALVARRFSVAGNPNWLTAQETRWFAYEQCGVNPIKAASFVLNQARLGFLAGRAVLAQGATGGQDSDWTWEHREWDIPAWFWTEFTMMAKSSQDWELGKFSGKGLGPGRVRWVTLSQVHFSADSVKAMASPPLEVTQAEVAASQEDRPPLPDAKLNAWWSKKLDIQSSLTEDELLSLVRSAHPTNSITRDRVRDLRGPMKRGPKAKSAGK